MTVAIPPGGLTIRVGEDGRVDAGFTLHVHFDVCPTWVELAQNHLTRAVTAGAARQVAWAGADENAKAATLELKFEASMQAVMAAAVSIDAFYAILQPLVALPALIERWRTGRTARYAQVAEVLRRAFRLNGEGAARLRENLKDIYRLRDLAVHPSGTLEAPIAHPEIGVDVEWRFVYFRLANAEKVVNGSAWILWDLCHTGMPTDANVIQYVGKLRQRLEELFPAGHPWQPSTKTRA